MPSIRCWVGASIKSVLAAVLFTSITVHAEDGRKEGDRPIVKLQSGRIQGFIENEAAKFLGVPYAKPPVGALRWAEPVAMDPWEGVRDATREGNICPQSNELGTDSLFKADEDCLYLNIFAPRRGRGHPVLLWLHGGGAVGHGNGLDGSALAREQGIVVVAMNFRIGALGRLIHPALNGGGATALYELRDQQFALQWIRDNIASFGGDANNVTLAGHSAGGADVHTHLISPLAKGLFHRAIFESGTSAYFNRLTSLSDAEERGRSFAVAAGCPDQTASCLRKLPVSTILKAQGSFAGSCCFTLPINDGHIVSSTVHDAVRSGQFNRVPILDVTTRDEYRWFAALSEIKTGHVMTAQEYPASIQAAFGADAPAVLAAYPLGDFDSPGGALGTARGDYIHSCQARSFDVDASKFVPVYAVEFSDRNSPQDMLPPVSFPYLASHGHDLGYLFPGSKRRAALPPMPLNADQEVLARRMRQLWGHFITTGSLPPEMPRVTKNQIAVVSLDIPEIRVVDDFRVAHKCDLWDSLRKWSAVQ